MVSVSGKSTVGDSRRFGVQIRRYVRLVHPLFSFLFTFDSQKCRIRFLKVRAFLSEVRQVCYEKEDLRPESPDRKTKTRKRRPPQIGGT